MNTKKLIYHLSLLALITTASHKGYAQKSGSPMTFDKLATVWDEAIPLGNSTIGSLVWQKGDKLRISIDRVDLWDLRTHKELSKDSLSFEWVYNSVMSGNYSPVQKRYDAPYDNYPGPSKIPGAGIEINLDGLGDVSSVSLDQEDAICSVSWSSGLTLECFIHATEPFGYFVFDGVTEELDIELVTPFYNHLDTSTKSSNDHSSHTLMALGYKQGEVVGDDNNTLVYTQECWGNFSYEIALKWERKKDKLYGIWSASSSISEEDASEIVEQIYRDGINKHAKSHKAWWSSFYDNSSITIPDKSIEEQYYKEIYKMGSIARETSYPISLQSVWTADNGNLPPWKGDYHHDLNTQLSHWPFYTGNYLKEGYGLVHTLWNQREISKEYTQNYFGVEGLNVPGVSTLEGNPMGGWCQYAMGPTVSSWLGYHFYLHWAYSQDREYLEEVGYPYVRDVATFIKNFTVVKDGVRTLPLSSSPEINDNSINAWFKSMTNYDLALIKALLSSASDMANALGKEDEVEQWQEIRSQLPELDTDQEGSLTFAKDTPYNSSHRHFSHAMAIHPLGVIDVSDGKESQQIIEATIDRLDEKGSDYWVGYSFAWLANIKARALDGDGAAEALRTFADCFCLQNGFHANGDQSGTGKSLFTYRPFTLEGNMAYAAGVQEMLLQSHTGVVKIFPAIPESWQEASFTTLRARGAFLVSATLSKGEVTSIEVTSEAGGELKIENPNNKGEIITLNTERGKSYSLKDIF